MPKIIKINENVVFIGLDNGSIKEVRKEDVSFEPSVGMKVSIFENESTIIITPADEKPVDKEKANSPNSSNYSKNDGINIVVTNTLNEAKGNSTEPTPTQNTVVYSSGKVVDKVTYCLLAFFLGGIGVHKFYAGKTGAGIAYLLFCWTCIPLIISEIEFIVALCKKTDSQGQIIV